MKTLEFNFGQLVLVRDCEKEIWMPGYFGFIEKLNEYPYVIFGGVHFKQCISYEGNEDLVGTNQNVINK